MNARSVRWTSGCLALMVLALGAKAALAAEKAAPSYPWPRVNAAISYQVAPEFFQRPAALEWGATPALAVDGKDQISDLHPRQGPGPSLRRQGEVCSRLG